MEEISKESLFQITQQAYGTVPGLIKELGEYSLPTAYLYSFGVQILAQGNFSETETNTIELKISMLNNCQSCIKGHSYLLKRSGMDDDQINAVLNGQLLTSENLNDLLRATEYIYHAGSKEFPELVISFFEERQISSKQVIEIIGLIAIKTISNYANNYLNSIKHLKSIR
jgi:AhpD family alkylhydroperoxidase